MGADGNTMSASQTDLFRVGYKTGITFFMIHLYDGHGAFVGADAVFFAFVAVYFQKFHTISQNLKLPEPFLIFGDEIKKRR